jgi:hypothetical protein
VTRRLSHLSLSRHFSLVDKGILASRLCRWWVVE